MIPDPRAATQAKKAGQDEQRQLASVREDLGREFANLSPAVIDEKVDLVVSSFKTATIRSFVPVLVRRGAREQLRTLV